MLYCRRNYRRTKKSLLCGPLNKRPHLVKSAETQTKLNHVKWSPYDSWEDINLLKIKRRFVKFFTRVRENKLSKYWRDVTVYKKWIRKKKIRQLILFPVKSQKNKQINLLFSSRIYKYFLLMWNLIARLCDYCFKQFCGIISVHVVFLSFRMHTNKTITAGSRVLDGVLLVLWMLKKLKRQETH